jgi:hypothetical protein
MLSHRSVHRARTLALTATAAGIWLLASVPSGFSPVQIAVFAGPGIVLALATDWASHVGTRREFDWRHGLKAAAVGATFFPPFVAVFFAWSGTFGADLIIALLVFTAWLALLCGFMFAGFSWLTSRHATRRDDKRRQDVPHNA